MGDLIKETWMHVNSGDFEGALRRSAADDDTLHSLTIEDRARLAAVRSWAFAKLEMFDASAVERASQLKLLLEVDASPLQVADANSMLADVLWKSQKYPLALDAATAALVAREECLGKTHQKTCMSLEVIVFCLNNMQRYRESLPMAQDLYDRQVEREGAASARAVVAEGYLKFANKGYKNIQDVELTGASNMNREAQSRELLRMLVGESVKSASECLIERILGGSE